MIFKGKWKLKLTHPSSVVVAVQEKGWMDEPLMLQYIKEVWSKFSKCTCSLLVLDSFKAHNTQPILDEFERVNTRSAIIPGGCTSKFSRLMSASTDRSRIPLGGLGLGTWGPKSIV